MFCVLGIDTSLTGTGVARIIIRDDGGVEIDLEVIKTKGSLSDSLWKRDARQKFIVSRIFDTGLAATTADLTLIESPAYGAKGAAVHDRSGLWWRVAARAIQRGGQVIEVTPSQRVKYALGKGTGSGTDKDSVLAAAIKRYPDVDIKNNNEADALLLAAIGARILGVPIESSLPAPNIQVAETLVTA